MASVGSNFEGVPLLVSITPPILGMMTSTLVVSDATVNQALTSLSTALDRLRALTFKARGRVSSGDPASQLGRPCSDSLVAAGAGQTSIGLGLYPSTPKTSSSGPPIVEWHDVAAQRFARLALTTFIEWASVVRALQEVYTSTTHSSDPVGYSDNPGSEIKIAGEYGLELVLRVLKRFQRFEFDDDKAECVEWCQRLEGMIQAQIVKCQTATAPPVVKDPTLAVTSSNVNSEMVPSFSRPVLSINASQSVAAETPVAATPAANPPSIQDTAPSPPAQHASHAAIDSSPSVRAGGVISSRSHVEETPQASEMTAPLSPDDSVPELTRTKKRSARAAQLDQVQVLSEPALATEANKESRIETTTLTDRGSSRHARNVSHSSTKSASPGLSSPTSSSSMITKQSAEFPVGSVVLAKGLEGREASSWTPAVLKADYDSVHAQVFDGATAPVEQAEILGKRNFASLLVSVLGGDTWHWIPASRLKPPSPSHISRLTKDLEHRLSRTKKTDKTQIQHLHAQMTELKLAMDGRGVEKWVEARIKGGEEWDKGRRDAAVWLTGGGEGEESQGTDRTEVCTCRKIWQEEASEFSPTELIGCESGAACKGYEWYHASCVGLDPDNIPDKYYCEACSRG
ncbi:BZ3500_MvSof-1268-A1-R1_Chr12-3g04042 [Microbotryum saponariae]|uniref:BZ3500_MvSof-1268-A1-R1_Chr12-3g04042 protein n=1 Tax=Microbotryum saponariae TaxID=289078 RepID=A0A2X0LCU4_9BASI|nr:BZ3500_MvSof-1268-A1-R1_Chr12-3g04042 [Microbotryum saponariae]SDA02588.1 BZ3501_MvSof-1269-A2-R1_Chr12-3g03697 [Microbotryum saponariae]